MKKIVLSVVFATIITLSFMACSNVSQNPPSSESQNNNDTPQQQELNISNLKSSDSRFKITYKEDREGYYDLGTPVELELDIEVISKDWENSTYTYQWCSADSEYPGKEYTIIKDATDEKFTVKCDKETYKYYFCIITATKDENSKKYKSPVIEINHTMVKIIDNDTSLYDYEFKEKYTYLISARAEIFNLSNNISFEPGTVLKFTDFWNDTGTSKLKSTLAIYKKIDIKGTAEKPIIFTSYRDNTVGVPIHGQDGKPANDDWGGLFVSHEKGKITMQYCEIRYAGGEQVAFNVGYATVDNCIFANNGNDAGTNCAVSASQNAVITNCTFIQNDIPFSCGQYYTVDTSNHFVVSGKENRQPYIDITTNTEGTPPVTYAVTEIAYRTTKTTTSEPYNKGLDLNGNMTIGENVTIKFQPGTKLFVSKFGGSITAPSKCTLTAVDETKGWLGVYDETKEAYDTDFESKYCTCIKRN